MAQEFSDLGLATQDFKQADAKRIETSMLAELIIVPSCSPQMRVACSTDPRQLFA
jgi:hypothetical protein